MSDAFAKLTQYLEGEDRVEAQVIIDAFAAVKVMSRQLTSVSDAARAAQAYEEAMSAAYKLFGRLFLEGKLNRIPKEVFK